MEHSHASLATPSRAPSSGPDDDRPPISIIGLGPMGRAMANVLLDRAHPATVWNRTASRADAVVARGATRAPSVAAALTASELVVLSLTDYAAMYELLAPAEEALAGRVIANLSSDTPERSREAAAWLAARGAELLVGGVMVPEELVGGDEAYVFYSGPRATFARHEPTLRAIGRPEYVGEDPGLAQLFYQAQLTIFLTALSGYLQATALVGSAGVRAETFRPYAVELLDSLSSYVADSAREIDAAHYPGEAASVTMMGATADHIVAASRDAGLDLHLPLAIKAHYDRAIAAGFGRAGWPSLIEGIRRPRSAAR